VSADELLAALERANEKYEMLHQRTRGMSVDVFKVLDFRVLSGMVGETYANELAASCGKFVKNPNIDGYPDLVQVPTDELKAYCRKCGPSDFIKYKYGGIEVKNTFGSKKANTVLLNGEQRLGYINNKLDWKAHHRTTNNLIALLSDYIGDVPVIVALFYSDELTEDDWMVKQQPKDGSAMTSFSAVTSSGFLKLKKGVRLCIDDSKYREFVTC